MSIEYDGSDKPIIGSWERATLPAAPAPTEQAAPGDFLMPEDAWNEYATRSGLLNEHGVAPHPATAQAAYFAYQAAWNCLHKAFSAYIAACATPSPAPIQQAEPVKYELRMRAPNGHCAPWSETDAGMYARYTENPDIGDGFTYETRALIVAPLAPTVKASQ